MMLSEKRRIYRCDTQSTLDYVVIECSNDGKYVEGWLLCLDSKGMPELRFATFAANDPQLIPLEDAAVRA